MYMKSSPKQFGQKIQDVQTSNAHKTLLDINILEMNAEQVHIDGRDI